MNQYSANDRHEIVLHEMFHSLDLRLQRAGLQPVVGRLRAGHFTSTDESFVEAFSMDVNKKSLAAIETAGYAYLADPGEAYAEVGARALQTLDSAEDTATFDKLFANTIANLKPKLQQLGIIR
jgi:uncharacterized damage-inducible protein DinB